MTDNATVRCDDRKPPRTPFARMTATLLTGATLAATPTAMGVQPGTPGVAQATPVWRVPDSAVWELIDGRGEITWREDRWVWDAAPPDRGGVVGLRLPVDLADFDELRFEYKPTHGPVSLQVTTDGYPDASLSRNWYDKQPLRENAWNAVAFALNLDDDGLPTRRPDGHDLWLNFRNIPATENDDPTRRAVEIRNVRLVRHPVRWEIDYFQTRTRIRENGALEIAYPITLRNRTDSIVEVSLELRREPPRTGEPLFIASRMTGAMPDTRTCKPAW